jgi:Flp pilus assembly protein TadG
MKERKWGTEREEGQSLVILAMALVGLLVFAGLAVDAGVIYVTSVRLSRAVDSAALAGVVELPYESSLTSTDLADQRALQFLGANEVWPTAEISGTAFFDSARQSGMLGTYRYGITATHQADLYFLPLVNINHILLRDSAVAEVNPLVNMYASQTGNYGLEQTSNLAIFGPDLCTDYGDPYTPRNSQWYDELNGVYHFQLNIPANYEGAAEDLTRRYNYGADTTDILRIEIWDPDCYNRPDSSLTISNTITGLPVTASCSTDRRNPCIVVLRDLSPPDQDVQNPFGFRRIDENRGQGAPPGNGQCAQPGSYTSGYNTVTEYTVYYYSKRADGSLERRDLARYTKGGADSDSDTDMLWVSPSGSLPDDPPADGWAGSPYGFAWDAGDGNFEIDLNSEAPNIFVNPADGTRNLFLDVRGTSGSSENGFDIWAGPRYINVPSEVNERNVDIVMHAGDYHSAAGATLFGMGHLPMNSNIREVVTLTLAYVPPEWAGRTLAVSNFDNDAGAAPPVTFLFDTMPYDDWHHDGDLSGPSVWATNVFTVPSAPDHTFYGGFLQVVYQAGGHDTFGWKITGEARPTLVQ